MDRNDFQGKRPDQVWYSTVVLATCVTILAIIGFVVLLLQLKNSVQ
jgi:hypothetical protein